MIQERSSDNPWFNTDIKKEIHIRDRLKTNCKTEKIRRPFSMHQYKSHRNNPNSMIRYDREQFFLSANELVDSFQRNDSKSCRSLIPKIMKGTSEIYSIPPLYDNDSSELIYCDKIMKIC